MRDLSILCWTDTVVNSKPSVYLATNSAAARHVSNFLFPYILYNVQNN